MKKIKNQDSKKSIASLWVDFALSLMLCATVITFTIFAKQPVDDINKLINMLFDFIKNNVFILVLFFVILFVVMRLRIVVNRTLEEKSNRKRNQKDKEKIKGGYKQ